MACFNLTAMTGTAASRPRPGMRLLQGLLFAAVTVSVVHYVDNVVNYADYPEPASGPAPSRELIAASWSVAAPSSMPAEMPTFRGFVD